MMNHVVVHEKVTKTIGTVNGLVFVSDRHKSIVKSIALVFPDNFHALCIHHLSLNLTMKFNNDNVCANFMLAAKACSESVFQYYWNKSAPYRGVQRYLTNIRLSRWARVYQGGMR